MFSWIISCHYYARQCVIHTKNSGNVHCFAILLVSPAVYMLLLSFIAVWYWESAVAAIVIAGVHITSTIRFVAISHNTYSYTYIRLTWFGCYFSLMSIAAFTLVQNQTSKCSVNGFRVSRNHFWSLNNQIAFCCVICPLQILPLVCWVIFDSSGSGALQLFSIVAKSSAYN